MKKLTKSIFVLMTASLAVTAPISAFAKDSSLAAQTENSDAGQVTPEMMKKLEPGLQKAARLLPFLKDYPIMEVEINSKQATITVNKYQAKDQKYPVVHLRFDQATGELLTFNRATGEGWKSSYPLDKSKESAIAFMKQWYGEDMGGYQLNEAMSASNSTITFNKLVNGIPVKNDAVILSVDSQGHVINKGVDGNQQAIVVSKQPDLQFADPKQALPKEQVEKLFASYMKPHYLLDTDKKTYKLLYKPVFSGEFDAFTGKDRTASVGIGSKLVQFQPKGVQPTAKTKEAAAAFLLAKTGYDFTKGRVVFEENSGEKGTINYLWKTESGVIGSIYVEKNTGNITNYQVLDTNQKSPADKKLTPEQALDRAVAELSEYLKPENKTMMLLGADQYKQYDPDKNLYLFTFCPTRDGIPDEDTIVQANIDAATGKALLLDWRLPEKMALPDAKKAMSAEEAAKIYLQSHRLELYYVMDEEKAGAVSLVYCLTGNDAQEVDALTGQLYIYGEQK